MYIVIAQKKWNLNIFDKEFERWLSFLFSLIDFGQDWKIIKPCLKAFVLASTSVLINYSDYSLQLVILNQK